MEEFNMFDLGLMYYFLGIEVNQSANRIFISQKKYASEILSKFGMKNCNAITTPFEKGLKLKKNPEGNLIDNRLYK